MEHAVALVMESFGTALTIATVLVVAILAVFLELNYPGGTSAVINQLR